MKVIATYTISNWGGIEVASIDEESVTYRWNFGTPEEWHKTSSHDGEWFQPIDSDEKIPICELCGVGF